MRDMIDGLAKKITRLLGSNYFFWFIMFLFVLQALWIALSFRYSMIYDEYYHFGLIEYFSHQWLPWISNQPTNLDLYGALDRNPYLLFHYLLSFPFRLVALFTDNIAAQVISMRIVNIGLFAAGLVAFNRLFKEMKIRAIFRNVTLLFLVLLPVTPFVAATVNYDNAIFLLTALFMIVGLRIIQSDGVNWKNCALILLIGMAGSLMKVSFLPIFIAGFVFLAINQMLKHKRSIVKKTKKSFYLVKFPVKATLITLLIIIGILFIERFGVNIVQYRSLSPSCEVQLSESRCRSNYVQLRAYELKENKEGKPVQFAQYSFSWLSSMISGLLVTGANTNGMFGTRMGQPMPIIYAVVFIGFIVSLLLVARSFNVVKNIPGFGFYGFIIILFVGMLFSKNVSDYYEYYQPIAIQGRYILPILPMMMLFSLIAINSTIKSRTSLKIMIFSLVAILYLNGAGLLTHIIRSDENWYWNNAMVVDINNKARGIIKPFMKELWY